MVIVTLGGEGVTDHDVTKFAVDTISFKDLPLVNLTKIQ